LSLSVPGAVFYVGIDWAAETHAVCVMDPSGKIVTRFTTAHSAEGLDWLAPRRQSAHVQGMLANIAFVTDNAVRRCEHSRG
jgi:hypothetical protein